MRTSSPDLTADVLAEYCFCGEEAMDALTRSEEYPTYNTYPFKSVCGVQKSTSVFIQERRGGNEIHLRRCSQHEASALLETRSRGSILHIKTGNYFSALHSK
jgi:hypothetical protein